MHNLLVIAADFLSTSDHILFKVCATRFLCDEQKTNLMVLNQRLCPAGNMMLRVNNKTRFI